MLQHLDDPVPLAPASLDYQRDVRRRGTVLKRRRTAVALGVPLTVVAGGLAAAVLWSVAPGPSSAPATSLGPTSPNPTSSGPTPSPVATASRAAIAVTGCGHGLACPQGTGAFRARLGTGRATIRDLAVEVEVPGGYRVAEAGNGGLLVAAQDEDAGLSALWPVRGKVGGDDAQAVATWLAGLPGSRSPKPARVSVDGHTAWRVVLSTDGAERPECIDPTRGLYVGENYLGFDQSGTPCTVLLTQVQARVPPEVTVREPAGTNRVVEITLVSDLGITAPAGADMLSLWRWAADLDTSPTRTMLEQLRLARLSAAD